MSLRQESLGALEPESLRAEAGGQRRRRVGEEAVSPFPLWTGFAVPGFQYTGREELRVIHEFRSRGCPLVQVVGLPDWGCYEWVVLGEGVVLAHSDDGFGESDCALREGVREWLRRVDEEVRS